MKILLLAIAVVVGPLGAGAAYADSDGYFCVGAGYLAYQFGMAPLPVAPHRLHVLRTGTAPGIPEPAILELPQFQVHGLRCGDGWIEVASFTAIYRVTFDDSARPVRYEVQPFVTGQMLPPDFPPQRNLGMLSPERARGALERVSLGGKAGGGHLVLELTGQDVPDEPCRVDLRTRVVEADRNGREILDRVLYQSREHRECAERGDTTSAGRTKWSLPVIIEALQDVPAQVEGADGQRRAVLYVGPGQLFTVRKGQRFLMVKVYQEGGCRIEFEQQQYDVSSCPWLDGFRDHQEDVFRVVSGNRPERIADHSRATEAALLETAGSGGHSGNERSGVALQMNAER